MTHTPVAWQVWGPDKPCQALTVEGDALLLQRVTWQTTSCWQRRRATLCLFWKGVGEWELSALLCKQFCSAFHKIFFLSYPSKTPCSYRHFFLFKIRSQYTWFSLFWLCTEVQKSQPSLPLGFPLICLQLAKLRDQCAYSLLYPPHSPDPANAPKSDQICSLFSNMAQFPGRVKIFK